MPLSQPDTYVRSTLPACFGNARKQTLVSHFSQADSAQTEISVETVRSAALRASIVKSYFRVFALFSHDSSCFFFIYHRFLSHEFSPLIVFYYYITVSHE